MADGLKGRLAQDHSTMTHHHTTARPPARTTVRNRAVNLVHLELTISWALFERLARLLPKSVERTWAWHFVRKV